MKIISVINYKGGVGKTTLTANIAAVLATLGKKILLVDMDAQCSLTFSFITPTAWEARDKSGKTLKQWFAEVCGNEGIPDLSALIMRGSDVFFNIRAGRHGGKIDLIPSHLDLLDVDLDLAKLLYGRNSQDIARQFVRTVGALRRSLRSILAENDYDIVLIDCPPNFNIVTQTAIVASEGIAIPVKPNYLSTRGISHLIRKRGELVHNFNSCLESAGMPAEENIIAPKIVAIIFNLWKVTSRGTDEMADDDKAFRNRIEKEVLPGIQVEGTKILVGVRHNNKLFADNRIVPAVFSIGIYGPTYDAVKSEIHAVAREFGRIVNNA